MKVLSVLVVSIVFGCVATSSAALITFNYQGTFIEQSGDDYFSPGDTYSLSYTFDSTTPDGNASTKVAQYFGAITSWSWTTSSGESLSGTDGLIYIANDDGFDGWSVWDEYAAHFTDATGQQLLDGDVVNSLRIEFHTTQTHNPVNSITTTDLPLTPPDPADWDTAELELQDDNGLNVSDWTVGPAAVPEPSTLVALTGLLGTGLIGYWCRRRKAA